MSVDGGLIDAAHRHLVDIVNSFDHHRSDGRPGLPYAIDCLNALKFYAETHFAREERLQLLVRFPEHRHQHDDHKALMRALDGMIWRAERALTEVDASSVVEELAILLRRWLLNHIITHDLRMKPYAAALNRYGRSLPPLGSAARAR
jgi:hemerythrin